MSHPGETAPNPPEPGSGLAWLLGSTKTLEAKSADVYRYMNFDQIAEFKEVADTVTV